MKMHYTVILVMFSHLGVPMTSPILGSQAVPLQWAYWPTDREWQARAHYAVLLSGHHRTEAPDTYGSTDSAGSL